jgi:hypothetical protein
MPEVDAGGVRHRGTLMIRPLLFPAIAAGLAAMLGGCVSGYQYRDGAGDYYYGQPSVEYRDYGYGPYGGAGYGYPSGWSGSIGYGFGGYRGYGGYGYPYGYGGYGYPYWRPPVIIVRPGPHGGHKDDDHKGDHHRDRKDDRPPWRNLGDLRPPTPMRVQTPTDSPRAIRDVNPPRVVREVVQPRPVRDVPPPRGERVDAPRTRAPERVDREHDGRRIRTP